MRVVSDRFQFLRYLFVSSQSWWSGNKVGCIIWKSEVNTNPLYSTILSLMLQVDKMTRVSRQWHKRHLIWARLAEDFESCLAEKGIFKTVGALFLRQVSTQHALLRTWNTQHMLYSLCLFVWNHLCSMCLAVPSERRSVMSSSREGMIFSNILKFFPKRGIWRMRQDGTWKLKRQ